MKRFTFLAIAGSVALAGLSSGVYAGDPPPADDPQYLPPDVDVELLGSFCSDDTPFVGFRVVPINGFEPDEPVTVNLTINDSNGERVGKIQLQDADPTSKSVSQVNPPGVISPDLKPGEGITVTRDNGNVTLVEGLILYPASDVLADGTPFKWPSVIEDPVGSGNYVDVPGEDAIRDGITITLQINPSATARIEYPQDVDGVCGGTPDDNTTTTVPGELPATGSESANPLQIGAILLAGGVMLFAIARRRIPAAPRPTG